jgi:hypothetical protein
MHVTQLRYTTQIHNFHTQYRYKTQIHNSVHFITEMHVLGGARVNRSSAVKVASCSDVTFRYPACHKSVPPAFNLTDCTIERLPCACVCMYMYMYMCVCVYCVPPAFDLTDCTIKRLPCACACMYMYIYIHTHTQMLNPAFLTHIMALSFFYTRIIRVCIHIHELQ